MVWRLLLAAAVAAGLASAQGHRGGGGNNNMSDMGEMPRVQRSTRFDTIAEKLKLNKEQKEQAAGFFDAAQEAAVPLNEEIANGRKQIAGAIMGGQNSSENFARLMAAYTAVLSQMAGLEATAYEKLYAILKPNQQSKAAQVFADQMPGLFAGRDWKRVR